MIQSDQTSPKLWMFYYVHNPNDYYLTVLSKDFKDSLLLIVQKTSYSNDFTNITFLVIVAAIRKEVPSKSIISVEEVGIILIKCTFVKVTSSTVSRFIPSS